MNISPNYYRLIFAGIAAKMVRRMSGEGYETTAWTTITAAQTEALLRLEAGNADEAAILTGVLEYLGDRLTNAVAAGSASQFCPMMPTLPC